MAKTYTAYATGIAFASNKSLVGIRPGYGKFVAATGTLTRSKTIALSLVAEVDRVYA